METKTEQQNEKQAHQADCICHLCLMPKPEAPQPIRQENGRAAYLAELTERAKQVAEEIHKEVCAVNRYSDRMPYVGISKMYNAANINVSVGMFDKSSDTLAEVLTELAAFNPDSDKDREIAELEAKLAALKGGAK